MRETPVATPITHSLARGGAEPARHEAPLPWETALSALPEAGTYWLATVRPDGAPHSVPVLAVLADGVPHICASDRSRKARNLASDPRCVLSTSAATFDLVIEGRATPVTHQTALQQVADAYGATYGWWPEVRDGGLWADGAPTAGPPPYRVHRLTPVTAYAFPTDDTTVPTRWSFATGRHASNAASLPPTAGWRVGTR